jgi:hypothetical protein
VRLRPPIYTGSLVLLMALPAGCGSSSSSNSIASKSAAEIVSESKTAADAASSVHVSGALTSSGSPVTLDLDLLAGKGARGELSQNGASFKIILVANTAYISGSPAFYRGLGGTAAAQIFNGKWLKASAKTGDFASFGQLADMRKLIDSTLAGHGAIVKGATTVVNGQKVIAVDDSSKQGTLYVATTGKPYPILLSKSGSETGKITFDRWNQPVTITAPANAVDLAELKALGSHK